MTITLAIATPPTSKATDPNPNNKLVNASSAACCASSASDGRVTSTWSGFSGFIDGASTSTTSSMKVGLALRYIVVGSSLMSKRVFATPYPINTDLSRSG